MASNYSLRVFYKVTKVRTRFPWVDNILSRGFSGLEGRCQGLKSILNFLSFCIRIVCRFYFASIGCRGATGNMHGTPIGRRPCESSKHTARPVLALSSHTVQFTHNDCSPWHLGQARHGNQRRTRSFNALFLGFRTDHETRFIRQGNHRQVEGVTQL